MDDDEAIMLASMTGLSLDAATVLLEAAGGDVSLAASLHFDGADGGLPAVAVPAPPAAAADESDDDDDMLTPRSSRPGFSVLAGDDASDDDIFAHIGQQAAKFSANSSGGRKTRSSAGKSRAGRDDASDDDDIFAHTGRAAKSSANSSGGCKARSSGKSRGGDDASDDDDVFAHIGQAAKPSANSSGGRKARSSGGRSRGGGKARATAGSLFDGAGDGVGGGDGYDMLALTADGDEGLVESLELLPTGRKAKKAAARSAPIRIQRQPPPAADEGGSASDHGGVSPSPTSGSAGGAGSASHRRRAKRSGHGVSGSCGGSFGGGGGSSVSPGSYSASELGLASVASVRGFEAASSSADDGGGGGGSGASSVPPTVISVTGFDTSRAEGGSGSAAASSLPTPLPPQRGHTSTPASANGAASVPLARSADSADAAPQSHLLFPGTSAGLTVSPEDASGSLGGGGGKGARGGGVGKRRGHETSGAHAERAISRLLWDPTFEAVRERVVVVWSREEQGDSRKSGAAAWSRRVHFVPCETRLPQFIKAGRSYLDRGTPYHLVTEIRLLRPEADSGGGSVAVAAAAASASSAAGSTTLWSAAWNTDRLDFDAAREGGESGEGGEGGEGAGGADYHLAARAHAAAAALADAEDEAAASGEATDEAALVGEALPAEIWMLVLSQLHSVRALCVMALVCTELHELSYEPVLWHDCHLRLFGCAPPPSEDDALTMRRVRRSEATMQPWRRRPDESIVPSAESGGGGRGGGGVPTGAPTGAPTGGSPALLSSSPPTRGSARDGAGGFVLGAGGLGSSPSSGGSLGGGPSPPLASSLGLPSAVPPSWLTFTADASGSERRSSRPIEDADDRANPALLRTALRDRLVQHHEQGSGGSPLTSAVRALHFEGGLLSTADGGGVRLWSIERRKRICTLKTPQGKDELHSGGVSSISIDGAHLLSGGGDGAMHLFDLEELGSGRHATPMCSMRGHAAPISDARLLPCGTSTGAATRCRVASSSTDGMVRLWDAAGVPVAELLPPLDGAPPAPLPLR